MISVVQQGDIYEVRFRYDPQFIALIKRVPGRKYNPDGKYWTIPKTHLGWLMKAVTGTVYQNRLRIVSDEHIGENATLDSTTNIPDIDISDVDRYVVKGSSLYEHQVDFLKYAKAKEKNGFILADDMGCISGDAIVSIRRGPSNEVLSLARLWRRFHNPRCSRSIYMVRACDPATHGIVFEPIRDVLISGMKEVYELELESGIRLRLTGDHEVLTTRGFVPAREIRCYNSIETTPDYICIDGQSRCRYCRALRLTYAGTEMTYDIKLAGPHHNFLVNDIFVHNCGKTLEVINYALYQRKRYGYKHCLIITCINAAKYAWQEDIARHTNGKEQAYILGSRKLVRGKKKGQIRYNGDGMNKVNDLLQGTMYGEKGGEKLPFFLIVNIEAIGRVKALNRKYVLAETIVKQIQSGDIPMIAIDECHKNMSPTSLQGKIMLRIHKATGRKAQWIPMTGTPIRNKPTDVYAPLKLVNGHEFSSFRQWSNEFCVYGDYGSDKLTYRNIPLLKEMLQKNMIRRTTEEVLDLPPRIYFNEYVENTKYQQTLALSVAEEMEENRSEIMDSMNPLTAFLRLRQVNGSPEVVDEHLEVNEKYPAKNAKLQRLFEIVEDTVARGEKIVIFSNWAVPLRNIYRFLGKKYKVCCYVGSMKEEDREKHKKVFINNPEYRIMLGTIAVLGASVTLTVANNVLFFDECWTPSDKEQAIKRCNRIGSTKPLNVFTLMSKDTVDERVHRILEDKDCMAKYIVDDQLDLKKNPELFDYLLGLKENL